MTNISVKVINQNNVDISVNPPARQVVNVVPPAIQEISINRGLIGPSGFSGYSGYSGTGGVSG